ncbi:COG4223 family protein [Rhizobium oryzicola]|uniref:Mitofilin family membrane protein n=1 Tax=Rhizobium oryzicola TaxID=1232668 RepID=A0ABT8T069_9HYPH|nr:mitofilin family membrane protein [Rhizobium oryzicola]MDO1584011.1 mitofilin family membrane protein [Rhizobium oryzicola]
MVSDKPPRRSRPQKEPVTIDLKAEQDAAATEQAPETTVTAPLQPDDLAARGEVEGHGEKPSPDAVDVAVAAEPAPPAEGTTDSAKPSAESIETVSLSEATPKPDTTTTEELKAEDATTKPEPDLAPPPPLEPPLDRSANTTSAPRGPTTSTLLASGIAGGIVALLLAGAMQYAGFLPSAGSSGARDASAEIAQLRQRIETLQSSPDLTRRVAALEASKSGSGGNSDQLAQQLNSLQGDLTTLKSALEAQSQNDTNLSRRLDQTEARLNQPGREQAIARALAAAGLKAATERGGGFSAELKTFASVAGDDPAVKSLQPYADRGVPTRAELVRRFPAAANAMIDAAHQQADQGVTDRLLSSAMRLVKIRPVGEAPGDTPEAIVARMEERVKNGDLTAAVSEWNALPEASKMASADYKKALDARIDIDGIASGTLTRAMAASQSGG